MALARKHLDWDAQFECAIDSERARSIHEARLSSGDACSMCGELCAIEVMKRALEGREWDRCHVAISSAFQAQSGGRGTVGSSITF